MIGKVLVPLDGSRLAEGILAPLAPILARGPEVTLLRVVEPPGPEDARDVPQRPVVEAAMRAQLEAVRGGLGADLRVSVQLVPGDPATEIARAAREGGHDLVAMATHGRTGVDRWIRGSVAERVLRTCDVPLFLCNAGALAAPAEARPFRRIVVPLDGSPAADRILPLVVELARGAVSKVTLLRVEPVALTEVTGPIAEGSLWDAEATAGSLAPQRAMLAAAGVDVEVEAAYGVVALQILRASEGADLLAMSSHGRSGLSRWWFGSVAEQVLRHARCPLLIVRAS